MTAENNIAVSVIVPVYNLEALLPMCLDSLLGQTMPDLEILCVDDGSRDASRQVVEDYQARDGRIRLLCQDHKGVSMARNLGITNAKGRYVIFVDGDDWVEPTMLETMLTRAEKAGSDMVVCSAQIHFLAPEKVSPRQREYLSRSLQTEAWHWCRGEDCGEIWRTASRPACWPFIWNKLIRRAVLTQYDLQFPPGLPLGEDGLFLLVLMQYTKRVDFLPETLYHYRYLRKASATARLSISLDTRFPQHCQVAACLAEQFLHRGLLVENGPFLLRWITEFLYVDFLKASPSGIREAFPLIQRIYGEYGLLKYAGQVKSSIRRQSAILTSPGFRDSRFCRMIALIHHRIMGKCSRLFLRKPK